MPTIEADHRPTRIWPPDLSDITPFSTERLTLRFHEVEDANALCIVARDWEVARWTARIPHPYEVRMAKEWVLEGKARRGAGEEVGFAILLNDDQSLIGGISLTFGGEPQRAEIGFFLGQAYWGHGYMREAASAVVDWGFGKLDLHTIWSETFSDNDRSSAVQNRLGFRWIERRVAEAPARGKSVPVDVRTLTKSDWNKRLER